MQKVKQFKHANQFIIEDTEAKKVIFQSYDSTIAIIQKNALKPDTMTLGSMWDYSKTTRAHLYDFIEEHCYLKDEAGELISYKLEEAKNKRAYIQHLIDIKIIDYTETF